MGQKQKEKIMPDNDTTKRFFSAIETERQDRRTDIAEIHTRIDQILDAVNNLSHRRDTGNPALLALFATVVLSLGTILGSQIVGVGKASLERHQRSIDRMNEIDTKIQIEIHEADEKLQLEIQSLDRIMQLKEVHMREVMQLKIDNPRRKCHD